jgi:plasmid maintenance system antidote protein VapI
MIITDQNKEPHFDVEIGLPYGTEWSASHLKLVKDFIKKKNQERSPEERLITHIVGLRYKMENYLEDEDIDVKKISTIQFFLDEYLKVLNLSFRKFAISIDTTDGNLKKYLSGERKFSTDLAMKFGSFFHTSPDLWMNICTKNDLLLLKKEKTRLKKYKKYDYKNVIQFDKTGK